MRDLALSGLFWGFVYLACITLVHWGAAIRYRMKFKVWPGQDPRRRSDDRSTSEPS